jgi:hypothetical protein
MTDSTGEVTDTPSTQPLVPEIYFEILYRHSPDDPWQALDDFFHRPLQYDTVEEARDFLHWFSTGKDLDVRIICITITEVDPS